MKRKLAALLISTALGLAVPSCGPAPSETHPPDTHPLNVNPAAMADVPAVVQGDTAFALDLYARLRGEDGNLFFSPYSISTALAMTRAGARGDTAAEMDKVLHFTLPQ